MKHSLKSIVKPSYGSGHNSDSLIRSSSMSSFKQSDTSVLNCHKDEVSRALGGFDSACSAAAPAAILSSGMSPHDLLL